MVASGEKGEARSPGFRVLRPGPEKWGAMDVRSAPPPRAPHIRHGRAFRARRRRASSPARTRPVSLRKRGPDDVRLWPLPRASQTDEEAGAAASRDDYGKPAKKQKKYGKLLGGLGQGRTSLSTGAKHNRHSAGIPG